MASKLIAGKKSIIELYRLLLTIAICLHHFRLYSEALPYGGGYLAVDFFFILSGVFLFVHYQKESDNSKKKEQVLKYATSRYLRLYPQYLFVLLISFIAYLFTFSLQEIGGKPLKRVLKFLMMDCLYVSERTEIMPQGWYCSALFFASVVVFALCCLLRKKFYCYFAPLLSLSIYAFLYLKFGYLNLYDQFGYIFSVGFYRGIAGLSLGTFIGYIVTKSEGKWNNQRAIRIILIVVSAICAYGVLWYNGYSKFDFVYVILFAIMIYLLFLMKDICFLFSSKFYIKMLNMMFLVHHVIALLFSQYDILRGYDWKIVSLVYVVAVIVVTMLLNVIWKQGYKIMMKRHMRDAGEKEE